MEKTALVQLIGLLYNMGLSHTEVGRILSSITSANSNEITEERAQLMGECMYVLHKEGRLLNSDMEKLAKLVEKEIASVVQTI